MKRFCLLAVTWLACGHNADDFPIPGAEGPPPLGGETGEGGSPGGAGGVSGEPLEMEPAGELGPTSFFRLDRVHRIEITMAPEMWKAFMADHTHYGLRPEPRWFTADFKIDGTVLPSVAFHTFGFGSRLEQKAKPNLSLDLNRNVKGQNLRGITRMRIKNNGQDITGLRQALIYRAMREANVMAPRSTFTDIFVNGEWYGFYSIEEAFNKSFVRERTGNDDGPAYEADGCQGLVAPADGCENIKGAYTRDFNPMVGNGETLGALCTAVNGPAEGFMARADTQMILREWVDQIAIDNAFAGDRDGYSTSGGNFRTYYDTKLQKTRMVILGPDDTFVRENYLMPHFLKPEPKTGCTDHNPAFRDIVLEKLTATPEGLAYYKDAVRKLRTGVMNADRMKRTVDKLWSIFGARIRADRRNVQYVDPERSKDEIKQYIDLRWAALEAAGL